jgi:spore coat polysaccharide biosynthesis protein SpsF
MRTLVIVQARMGSTRLPGKVLADLAGRTVLEHVLERCAAIPGITAVCCATTDAPADEPVAAVATALGALVARGSEMDVLGRYAKAARQTGADVILRVTSDCPLIDPAVCGAVLSARADAGVGFATNNEPPSWPHGLDCEAFTMELLERADREAGTPEDREHVSPFMRRHGPVVNVPCPEPGLAGLRWTLDTAEDLEFLRELVPLLPAGPAGWTYAAPLAAMRRRPALRERNALLAARVAGSDS